MTANTAPIFVLTPNNAISAGITAANTATDGTGTVYPVFTAGANGSYLRRIRVKPLGTNVATVMRVFINNGSSQGTAANNILWGELSIPASTASNSASIAPDYEYQMNLLMKASYVCNVCFGTATSAGNSVMGEGGDY